MLLQPKNWATFQHYKDRCPPWIKLHRDLLINREFVCLPIASKALAPMLWLLASEAKDGVFDASLDELMFRLHITEKEYRDGLKPLIDKGFFINASTTLAESLQQAIPETETETERERETEKRPQRGSRLPSDFLFPKEWADFCHQERPDLNIQKTFDSFKDFWVAKPGTGGVKLDWFATWRNWVRNQKQSFAKQDIVHTTVPSRQERDPALAKLDADRQLTKPPSLETLARLAALRQGIPQ
jgi:hypothetical protein